MSAGEVSRLGEQMRELTTRVNEETANIVQQAMETGMEEVRLVAKLVEDCGGEFTYERTITFEE